VHLRRLAPAAAGVLTLAASVLAPLAGPASGGAPLPPEPVLREAPATTCAPSLTADGGWAYQSVPPNLTGFGPRAGGVYRRDLVTQDQERLVPIADTDSLGCGAVSPDGRLYAFTEPSGSAWRVVIVDTVTKQVSAVPIAGDVDFRQTDGLRFGADHRMLYWLGPFAHSLWRYDTSTPATPAVKVADVPVGDPDQADLAYSISADGLLASYSSQPPNGPRVVIVTSAVTGQSLVVSTSNGQAVSSGRAILAADGSSIVYETPGPDVATLQNPTQIIRFTFASNQRELVTHAPNGDPANTLTHLEDLSDDGQVVAFSTAANNLTPGVTYHPLFPAPQILPYANPTFVRRRDGSVALMSTKAGDPTNAASGGGDDHARLDASGSTIVFSSKALDLVAGYHQPAGAGPQVYSRPVGGGPATLVSANGPDRTLADVGAHDQPDLSASGGRIRFLDRPPNLAGTWELARLETGAGNPVGLRRAGADRYDTAAQVSSHWFVPDVAVAYVASGENFPDALAAATATGAPVLLTAKSTLPSTTRTELDRLHPHSIVVVGGTLAIDDSIISALHSYTEGSVSRVAGTDRYATAVELSRQRFPERFDFLNTVFVATGEAFPDALTGGPVYPVDAAPFLLVQHDAVPAVVATELARLHPTNIVVLGGTAAISDATVQALAAAGATVTRRAGADRYATSVVTAQARWSPGVRQLFLAVGDAFPDALAAEPVAGEVGGPVLLVHHDCVPGVVADEIARLRPESIVVLGGQAAITDAALTTRCAT
jgi:putative cell wall-binding protein